MSPQIQRNAAARTLFEELRRRYPDIDREWLRASINAIAVDELKLIRRDLTAEVRRNPYYHVSFSGRGKEVNAKDAVISLRTVFAQLDRRISGENV